VGSLVPRFRIFAQESASRRRCIGAFDRTQRAGPLGIPVQLLPCLPSASAFGVPVQHPRVFQLRPLGLGRARSRGSRVGIARPALSKDEANSRYGTAVSAMATSGVLSSARAMSRRGPLQVSRCTGSRTANKALRGATRRLGGTESASSTKKRRGTSSKWAA
jgi:hypothetical protein